MSLYPSTVAGRRIHWLLSIEWAGIVIRLADDQLDIATADGDWLQFDAGLDGVELSEAISLLGDSVGQLSVPLEFLAPKGTSIAERIAQGDDLSSARGELSRWVEGSTYEERRVVLSGRLADPEYGGDDEPVSTSLEEVLYEDTAIIPPASSATTSTAWPHTDSLSDAWVGATYPIIIGRPGAVATDIGPQGWVPGSPALWVDHRFPADPTTQVDGDGAWYPDMNVGLILVVAGHHVASSRVYANTDGYTLGFRFKVNNGFDADGNAIAFIAWYYSAGKGVGVADPDPDPFEFDDTPNTYVYTTQYLETDSEYTYGLGSYDMDDALVNDQQAPIYVGWYDSLDTDYGGLVVAGKVIREAGDVLEYLLGLSTLAVDRGRLAAAKPALSRYLLDGCISARVSPWDVLRDEILPLLPVSLVSGPSGLYPVVWRYDARPEDADHILDADADPAVERIGRIRYDSSDRANRLTLSYAYSYRRAVHAGAITYGAAGDEGVTVHPLCTWARARTGREVSRTLETAWVYDTATAYAVMEWQTYAYCLPTRTVDYALPEADYITIERGDVVRLTDSTVYLDGAVGLVSDVRTTGGGLLEVSIQLLDHPLARAG